MCAFGIVVIDGRSIKPGDDLILRMSTTNHMLSPVAVVGAGALGCLFGGLLARAGAAVMLIGRPQHVAAIQRDGLRFDSAGTQSIIFVTATVDIAAVRGARLVLFCV